jgi:EmrB/QacA subfamily drug resistance transporter
MLSVLMASMEISIISTALPTIVGEFQSFESFAWVGTAYIVSSAIGTPLLGKLSDLFGRRTVFQSTLALFIVGSLLCGFAQSLGQLIAFRAVQGLWGGAIQALAFAIIGDILPPRERGRYIGYFTLAFVGAALLGPLIGGFIVDHFDWAWIFWINVPLGLVAMAVNHRALRLPFPRREAKIDWWGAGVLAVGVACLMVALEVGQDGWTEGRVLLLFAGAAVSTVAFIGIERRVDEPIIPLRLFADRVVSLSIFVGMTAGIVAYGVGQFLPLYFQDSLFVSPTESGLRMLPQMLGVTMATFGIGRLIARTGRTRPWPIVGLVCGVAGLFAVSRISGTTSYVGLILPMIAIGFAMAAVFTTTSIVSQNAVEFTDMGVVTSTVMFFRNLGGSIGLAVFGTLLNSTKIQALPAIERQAVIDSVALGVGRIYLVAAGVFVVGLLLAFLLPERPLRQRAGLSDAMEQQSDVV